MDDVQDIDDVGRAGATRPPDRRERPVLRVRSVADLLALVPVTLGFEPVESLVVVGVAGRHPGFQVRVDLPDRSGAEAVADHVTAAVMSQGCTRVAVVAFSGQERRAAHAVRVTARRLERVGVELLDELRSDGRRYWSLTCADERCCPSAGRPYDPTATAVRAEAVLAGRTVVADRAALAARYGPVRGPARVAARAAVRAVEDEAVAMLGMRGRSQLRRRSAQVVAAAAPVGAARVDAVLDQLLAAGDGDPQAVTEAVTDRQAAILAVWCSVVPVRDLAWSRMTRDDAAAHLALWTAVSRRVVPPYEPAVLGLTAFAAWLSGDGASAWCVLDRCARVDPRYSMAALLHDALQRCMAPDLWRPIPREVVLAACGVPARAAG